MFEFATLIRLHVFPVSRFPGFPVSRFPGFPVSRFHRSYFINPNNTVSDALEPGSGETGSLRYLNDLNSAIYKLPKFCYPKMLF